MVEFLPGQQMLPGLSGQPVARETVMNLLRDFPKQQGCDAYKGDSQKVQLLITYLWLRQLVPSLPFEVFLEKFASVADYNDENRKHPEDALAFHCPRSAAAAAKSGKPQWPAKDCVGILALYVDMVREAEAAGVPVPMNLDQYLDMDAPAVKSGEVALPKADPVRGAKAQAAPNGQPTEGAITSTKTRRTPRPNEPTPADPDTGLPPSGTSQLPTGPDQRVIYKMPSSERQRRGRTLRLTTNDDRTYVDFETDEGEVFEGCNYLHFTVVDEPLPPRREDVTGKGVLWVPKAQYQHVADMLKLTTPSGGVKIGESLFQMSYEFKEQKLVVDIDIVNSETGPYVDARLFDVTTQEAIVEEPPRTNILGTYRFERPEGVVVLEVKTRE